MKTQNKSLLIFSYATLYIAIPLLLTALTVGSFLGNLTDVKSLAQNPASAFPDTTAADTGIQLIQQSPYLSMEYKDYRAFVLDKYFALNNSPLMGYGSYFVSACDKYKAPKDCTLVAAIAYVETKLCTQGISLAQYNCWGWGGSNENRILFQSFPDAIDTVTKELVSGYGSIITKPILMQSSYCGKDCLSWGTSVIREQNRINNLAKNFNLPPIL